MNGGTNGAGLCWGCDYPLLGISSGRCPECGREFVSSDWRTMNMGRGLGRWGRWAILPVGWWVVAAGVVGCAMVWVVTRWPVHSVDEWFVDLRFYLRWGDWRERWAGAGWRDVVYLAGLLLWMLIVVAWWGGGLIRLMALERLPVGAKAPVARARGRHWLLLMLLLWTVVMVGAGWPYRLGEAMVSRELARLDGRKSEGAFGVKISEAQQQRALWAAALGGGSSRGRMTALGLLVENLPSVAPGVIEQMLEEERDAGMKAWELRLLGLYRGRGVAPRLAKYFDDSDAGVRAAAVDGVALAYGGTNGLQFESDPWGRHLPALKSNPPIELVGVQLAQRYGSVLTEMPESLRERVLDMMVNGKSSEEREAAARAAAGYRNTEYHLRLAEWGVWLLRGPTCDRQLESVLSEIPPFVHQTGDSLAEIVYPTSTRAQTGRRGLSRIFRTRFPTVVTKPVVHLTADRPMSVECVIAFGDGRPWYVYPKPDDFEWGEEFKERIRAQRSVEGMRSSLLGELDPSGLAKFSSERKPGYPWIEGTPEWTVQQSSGLIAGIGLHWEKLIISPAKLPWMKEADVGPDPKFAWWRRLREVDCSWVCSRGESERFLYYDGPTLLRCPVEFGMEGEQLVVRAAKLGDGEVAFTQISRTALQDTRRGLLVRVHGGVTRAERVSVPVAVNERRGEWPRRPVGTAVLGSVVDAFLEMVKAAGLTEPEARGMLDCWRRALFETEGTRVFMFLLERDYDAFCPMTMRPPPTETARVGVIWAEME